MPDCPVCGPDVTTDGEQFGHRDGLLEHLQIYHSPAQVYVECVEDDDD